MHIPADTLVRFFSHAMLLKLTLAKYYGLNAIQFLTLLLVGETTIGISIKTLKQRLAVPGSSLTFTLNSLEKKRLIKRSRSNTDRRQWTLNLTVKGQKLYAKMLVKESQTVAPALEGFDEDEQAAFIKIAEEISRPKELPAINESSKDYE
jgi:DNA-binding MarR family transcriptional regulator